MSTTTVATSAFGSGSYSNNTSNTLVYTSGYSYSGLTWPLFTKPDRSQKLSYVIQIMKLNEKRKTTDRTLKIYEILCSTVHETSLVTEKLLEKYSNIMKIAEGNSAVWLMLSKDSDKDVSEIATFIIQHY